MKTTGSLRASWRIWLFATAFLWSCAAENSRDQISGTATDAENTVAANTLTGVILDSAGSPVVGAQVRLVTDSVGFASSAIVMAKQVALNLDSTGEVRTAVTDSLGRYKFSNVDSFQLFHLSVYYQSSAGTSLATLLSNVYLNSPALKTIPVTRAASVSGVLKYNRGTDPRYQFSNHFYATVPGTGVLYSIFDGEPFLLKGLPHGFQEILIFPADKGMVQLMLNRGLPLDSMVKGTHAQLVSGGVSNLGTVQWGLPLEFLGTPEDSVPEPEPVIRLMSGVVLSYLGEPVQGAEVRLVLDTLGFSYANGFPGGDSLSAITDNQGKWSLPIPANAFFNLEFLKYFKADSLVGYALLPKVRAPKITDKTLAVDTVILDQPARIKGMIRYTEEPNAWIDIGSHFRIGLKGTTRYVDVIAFQPFYLTGLPSGTQSLVYYPGDEFLWPTFETELGSLEAMIGITELLNLTPGTIQELQVDTYTLPGKP